MNNIPSVTRIGALLCTSLLTNLAAAQVRADFNGDGFDDIAVSAFKEDVNAITDSGVVHIFYGSANGVQLAGNDYLTQSDFAQIDEVDDRFGEELAAGDFNGDGFDDLAIGVPGEDLQETDQGVVLVVRGSAAGISSSGWQILWQTTCGGPQSDVGYGSVLAAGDWDADGYDDLAIGMPFQTVGNATETGAVEVRDGSANGLTGPGFCWSQGDPAAVAGLGEAFDHFGSELCTGDFNGDGADDLAIGVIGENTGSTADTGGVVILLGDPPVGLNTLGTHYVSQQFEGGAEENDEFGHTMVSADFNDDGYDDLAITAARERVAGYISGQVEVRYGGQSGITTSGYSLVTTDPGLGLSLQFGGEKWGEGLAAGDWNGDGVPGLVVGSPGYEQGPFRYGIAIAFYGNVNGMSSADHLFMEDCIPVESGDFGASMGIGDFNGDGRMDLLIGSSYTDVVRNGTRYGSAGSAQLRYGRPFGLGSGNCGTQDFPGVLGVVESDDRFGYAFP